MSVSPRSRSASPRASVLKTCSSVVQRGEGCDIRSMATSHNDVWTADRAGNLTIRSMDTGEVKNRTKCDEAVVWCLTEVGNSIWAGLSNGYIEIFNSTTYEVMDEILPVSSINNTCGAHCIYHHYDSVFIGYGNAAIIRWSVDTRAVVRQYRGHADVVRCLRVKGDKLYSGSNDSTIAVWDITAEKQIDEWNHDAGAVLTLEVTNTHLWSGGEDSLIRVWDTDRGVCVRVLELHGGAIGSILFTADRVWCGSWDGTVSVWNPKTLRLIERVNSASNECNVMSLIQVKRTLVTQVWVSSSDKVIRKWECETTEVLKEKLLQRQLDESREMHFHASEEVHNLKGKLVHYGTVKQEREVYKSAAEDALILLGGDEEAMPHVDQIHKLIQQEAESLQDHVAEITSERDQYAQQAEQLKQWVHKAQHELNLETKARKQWQAEAARLQDKLALQDMQAKRQKVNVLSFMTREGTIRRAYKKWVMWLHNKRVLDKVLLRMNSASDRGIRSAYFKKLLNYHKNKKMRRSALLLCGNQGMAGFGGAVPMDEESVRERAALMLCSIIMSTTPHGRMLSSYRRLQQHVVYMKKTRQRLSAACVLVRGCNNALIRVYLSKLYLFARDQRRNAVRKAQMRTVMRDTMFSYRRTYFGKWQKWYEGRVICRQVTGFKTNMSSGLQKLNEGFELSRCFCALSKYVMWRQQKKRLRALRDEYRLKAVDVKKHVDIHDAMELRGFIIATRDQMLRKLFDQYDLLSEVPPVKQWTRHLVCNYYQHTCHSLSIPWERFIS